MARIYLLINVLPGKDTSIRDSLRGVKGVTTADVVTGPYDIVATLEGEDTSAIYNTIVSKIRKLKGITRTETFVSLE